MLNDLVFLPFTPEHIDGCLDLFDRNSPEYFAPNEREDYASFLVNAPSGYRVGMIHGRIAAAFGVLDTDTPGECRLNWILVDPRFQGTGLGARMIAETIRLSRETGARLVHIAASHKSAPFFAKVGARAVRETRDGWGAGMHRIDMELRVS